MILATCAVALAAVLVAIGFGLAPRRLWPVAGFLALAIGSFGYSWLASRAQQRRAARLRGAPVPRGVLLKKPLWMRADESLLIVGLIALPATLFAAVGLPSVGVGMLLVAVAAGGLATFFPFMVGGDLALEESGLRLTIGRSQCLVPWGAITGVEAIGPDHFQMVQLDFEGLDEVVASVAPGTAKNRKRAHDALRGAGTAGGQVTLFPWSGGVDGRTLERAIREGMAGRREEAN
jgi:hypothetical protein